MTKTERIQQRNGRVITAVIILASMIILAILILSQSETYAIESESDTTHYKYVKQYTVDATYIGDGNFVDENGNEWAVDEEDYTKGKVYKMTMHDNGTVDNIEDDVITNID
ncbi:hypothetical protein [uncultured Eubacterium sp.]|uniref:hypothetical protein n=1 Tax=uncultured Eubacterium sp. TaxID=165185 RepID=UPI0025974D3C|nr:hypothetical protein [uncultured Eubacterium sp.]